MKLSKSQRHTAYIIMLAEAEEGACKRMNDDNEPWHYGYGLCHLINQTFDIRNDETNRSFDNVTSFFSELHTKISVYIPAMDEQGWEIRKEYLRQCISETEF